MSASTLLFLTVRALHVLLAAAWLGSTAFLSLFVLPSLDEAGPAGSTVMAAMGRRRVDPFFASIGGTTVLTGLWLYWRFTSGFDRVASATMAARLFGAGGLAGILALIIAGSIVGRTARKMIALASKEAASTDSTQRAALQTEIAGATRRISTYSKIVLVLQVVALVCMAIGHYV